ncbi:MAG: CBASS cGAMP-activated phospholipase [Acidobacteriota bacterium]
MVRKILSIDGGGIRGLIPALVLEAIEEKTGRPTCSLFDLIAGTSTGGILALGLTRPAEAGGPMYSASALAELYELRGSEIFASDTWRRLRSFDGLADEKYSAAGLERALDDYFGEVRLQDALAEVLITSYEIERRIPWFFKRHRALVHEDYDFLMKDVARCTSAAPTYFEPKRIETSETDYWALIDGGVYANNPAMCAYIEAKTLWPEDELILVSLGTGALTRRLPAEEAKNWGVAQWAQPILDIVFQGVSSTVDYQLGKLLDDHYHRFEVTLSEGSDDMDDASPDNLRLLRLHAEGLIREDRRRLEAVCELLVAE